MNHLTPDELSAHLDHALSGSARERVDRHLAECGSCREMLAALASQEEALRPALEHDPGDAYFEGFAARVEDRLRAAGLQGAQARQGDRWLDWLRSPRRIAWVGAVAVAIVGAGVVMLTTRLERPDLRRFELEQKRGAAGRESVSGAADATPDVGRLARRQDEKRDAAEEFAHPPAAKEEGASAAKVESQAVPPEGASLPTRSSIRSGPLPQRSSESRRTAGGEDVPVSRREAAAAPAAPSAADENAAGIVKPQAAPAEKGAAALTSRENEVQESAKQAGEAPAGSLCGRVVDGSGNPVARARVTLVESGRSVATDAAGRFCLEAAPGAHELSVMAVGFRETRLQARAGEAVPAIQVTLTAVSVLDAGRAPTSYAEPRGLAKEPRDVFSPLPDSVRTMVRDAQAVSADGWTRRSTARLDDAARRWESVLSRLPPGAMEAEARFRLAEARVREWRLAPRETRHDTAVAAVRRALESPVSDRQAGQLKTWLRDLGL